MIDVASRPGTQSHGQDRLLEFTRSELFAKVFEEGMELVEETAAYLDGPGRADSRRLGTDAALIYATQSMRLTTRLMQIASWLLVQKSVRENEMSLEDASADKYRIHAETETEGGLSFQEIAAAAHALPGSLLGMIARSDSLYKRVHRLDASLYAGIGSNLEARNAVANQLSRLQDAFDRQ